MKSAGSTWLLTEVPERPAALSERAGAERLFVCEYAYYFAVFYSIMATPLGISIPLMGLALHAAIAAVCMFRLRATAIGEYWALTPAILCAGLFVAIQTLVHNESIQNGFVRSFVPWMLTLIIIKSLCTRPGFLQRFGFAMFAIGMTLVPFMVLEGSRAALDRDAGIVLANPNQFAEWFGFCAILFAVRALEARRTSDRWAALGIALFSLSTMAMAVSRGTLAAVAAGVLVALRGRLGRGFIPVLLVAIAIAAAFSLGVFDEQIDRYVERGMEGRGRQIVWPLVIERFLDSPYTGVGVSNMYTPIEDGFLMSPHNAFLYVAVTSGIAPLLCFGVYWLLGWRGAARARGLRNPNAAYLAPLLTYAFVVAQFTNQNFDMAWSVLSVCVCLHFGLRQGTRRTP